MRVPGNQIFLQLGFGAVEFGWEGRTNARPGPQHQCTWLPPSWEKLGAPMLPPHPHLTDNRAVFVFFLRAASPPLARHFFFSPSLSAGLQWPVGCFNACFNASMLQCYNASMLHATHTYTRSMQHTHTHTHRNTGTHTHTHIHTGTQAYTHTHTHRHTHTHTHTHTNPIEKEKGIIATDDKVLTIGNILIYTEFQTSISSFSSQIQAPARSSNL